MLPDPKIPYRLTAQAGYNLRRANQRHVGIFMRHVQGLTPTQFAALARLAELGPLSQNRLGRETAMDSATIKGVVGRLRAKGLVALSPDPADRRLRNAALTQAGAQAYAAAVPQALAARAETLAPLSADEAALFEALLERLV